MVSAETLVTPAAEPLAGPLGIRRGLAGRHLLLTGATGFIGEALLARLLRDVPECRVSLLVRSRGTAGAGERARALLTKPAFGGQDPEPWLRDRVRVIDGDLHTVPELPPDLDVVVHCAGEVSFDPPVDEGFEINVHGTARLLEQIHAEGNRPHYVHISTAYVAGQRRGVVPEDRVDLAVDWRAEAAAAGGLRRAAEESSRSPVVLAGLRRAAERDHGRAGPLAVAQDTERRRVAWVTERLVAAGAERARSLGWTDVYTFTKAMGERVVEELAGDLPVSIVRPAIVESALLHPYPGWIEGFKMAEPIILAFGRGGLPEFPGAPDAICDIVPVDHVVGAMLAAAALAPEPGRPRYLHVSTGDRNPLTFRRLHAEVSDYFTRHPLERPGLGAAALPTWTWPGMDSVERLLGLAERAHGAADRVVGALPSGRRVRQAAQRLDRQGARLEFLRRYHDLYRPYVQTELVFSVERTLALHAALEPAEQADFGFDPAGVDWTHYLRDTHCPSITTGLRAMGQRPRRAVPSGLLPVRADHPAIAAFDLDGTLMPGNVVQSYLGLRLPGLDAAARGKELAAVAGRVPAYLLADSRDRGGFLRSMYRRYEGADLAALDRLVDDQAAQVLDRLSPAALRRLREHRAAGHVTILLTGAIRALTRPLAPLFDVIVAADLEADDAGRATGFLVVPPLVGEARAAWVRREAMLRGIDPATCYAYADSHTDLPLLSAVGTPVAVNPDVALARAARRARWQTVEWGPAR
jgi:phosphoserine phosphatase/nucleoside-diphosphate-sugar epimerase